VQLIDNSSAAELYIYNLHLDSLSQSSRAKSVKQLAKHIAARKTDDPFIVMGDFNMTIENPAMQYLQTLKTPQMKDAWLEVNAGKPDMGTYHSFSGKQNGPKIDHIPLSENVQALQVTVDQRGVNGKFPSDHYPVIAQILLKKPLLQAKNAENIFPELKNRPFKKLSSF
jgi:endonuclease/exonuclease/phosphatase family metal-dependent hydrolase